MEAALLYWQKPNFHYCVVLEITQRTFVTVLQPAILLITVKSQQIDLRRTAQQLHTYKHPKEEQFLITLNVQANRIQKQ